MKRIIGASVLAACALGATAVAQDYQHDPHWPANLDQFAWGVSSEEEASPDGSVSGVDVDLERGIVYVLSRTEPTVRVFTVTGELVRAWSPARVERPHMLHVDPAGDLWITDVGLHTATLYSPDGVPKLVLGTPGVPGMDATHFDQPTDVATSENGDVIFVSDGYGNNRIATFDRHGRYLFMWGGAAPGTGNGEFILPHSITRLEDRLYVADRSGGRIQVFDLEGNFIEDWRNILEPWGVAARDGHVYVVGRKYGKGPLPTMQSLIEYSLTVDGYTPGPVGQDLMVFDSAGNMQAHSVLPQGQTAGAVDWVHGVGVDAAGAVYIVDVVGNRAQKWLPVTPAPGDRLDAVIADYVEHNRGDDFHATLQDVTPEAAQAEIAALSDMLERLRLIDAATLSTPASIDLRLLTGLLESDIYSLERLPAWRREPALYLPSRRIAGLLDPLSASPPSERARELVELLNKLPKRFALARENLAEPPTRFTQAAIYEVQATAKSLREQGDALVKSAGVSGGDLVPGLARADRVLANYLRFLQEDLLPRSTDAGWMIGAEHYNYRLLHRWHMDVTAQDILARGRQAFADTEALAQEVAERIDPGRHWSEVYEDLKDEHPPIDGIKDAYQAAIDDAQAFVIENEIVTLPQGENVVTVDTPPAMRRASPFGTFQSVDRFGDDLTGKLVLTPIPRDIPKAQQAERLRSHHNAWIPVIAVHEAYPGHHVDALKTRENPRPLRKVVREPIFSEGWGLFTEELMYEQGFLQGDDVRLTQLRNRLWRAARVILDSSLHTGSMTFEEAVDFLVEKVRFERHAAELEVGMYIQRPTYVLGYLIGMQEIMALREDYIAEFGAPSPPSEFYDLLLRAGSMPPNLVREAVFYAARERASTTN